MALARWSLAAAVLLAPGIAHALKSGTECKTDKDGQQVCVQVTPPPPPTPVIDRVTVVGIPPTPLYPDGFNRYLWELLNRQTSTLAPDAADIGGHGTEGNGGAPADSCGEAKGNPIFPSTGNKIEAETDFTSAGEMPLHLTRTWNQHASAGFIFGSRWLTNFDLRLEVHADGQSIVAHRPSGAQLRYVYRTTPSVAWWEDRPDGRSRIVADGAGGHVLYAPDNTVETYGAHRRITSQKNPRGVGLAFQYRTHAMHWTPLLERVTHTSGRAIQFTWTDTPIGPQMTRVVDPGGNAFTYAYDAYERLQSVVQPGTPGTTITYHYPLRDAMLLGKSLNGVRYSTFAYDANGRATLTEHAGGADRHTFAYTDQADGTLRVEHTNPLGKRTTSIYKTGKLQSATGHASASCPAAYREVTYDENGHEDLVADFAGNLIDFDHAPSGLLLRKVEAAGTPDARETTYAWDANGRTTRQSVTGVVQLDYSYRNDGLLDRIATTNLSPHGVTGQMRATEYRYTFHPDGMVASVTVDGPLPGTGDAVVTKADAFGNVVSIANELGHATTYANHNVLGQPGRETNPNGGIIDRTYDARGRLLTLTRWVNGIAATTTQAWDNRGNLASLTTPDGVRTVYAYDGVSRLVEVTREKAAPAPMAVGVFSLGDGASFLEEGDPGEGYFHEPPPFRAYACHKCDYEDRPGVAAVQGTIDGVWMTGANAELHGWACTPGINASMDVHLYIGGPAGIGQFVVAVKANLYSEAAVSQSCGTSGTWHRYAIPLFEDFRQAHGGKAIFVHGIALNGAPNALLANSGHFGVPHVILDAVVVSQQVPATMIAGTTTNVTVQVRNTGNAAWAPAKNDRLGSQNPGDNMTWGLHRVAVPGSVSPGSTVHFVYPITAPSTPGTYAFQWRMVRDGVAWFGAQTPTASIVVQPAPPPDIDFQRFTYNANSQVVLAQSGRRIAGVDAITRSAATEYDELGRVRVAHGNAGQRVVTTYDDVGQPTTVTDAAGRTTTNRYDALGRVVEHIDAAGARTLFTHDAGDRLTRVIDPRGNATAYVYDGFGQLWAQYSPDSGTTTMQYNDAGLRTQLTRADGTVLLHVYDGAGRPTWTGNAQRGRTYSYDWCDGGKGRLCGTDVAARQGDAWISTNSAHYAYTPLGDPLSKRESVYGALDQTGYAVDGMGRVTGIEYPSGMKVRHVYANGALTGVYASFGAGEVPVATGIQYQPFGAATGWTYGNGITRSYTYDLDGRVTAISAKDAASVKQSLTYQHNAIDQITRITNGLDANLTQDYGYDALDRLTAISGSGYASGYAYDTVGNRIGHHDSGTPTTYDVDPASNRLRARSGHFNDTWMTNAVGNTTAYSGSDGVMHALAYDTFNRIAAHTRAGVETRYEINALDQRVGKWSAATGGRRFVSEGHRLLAEVGEDGKWTNYIWLGNELIGLVRNNQLHAVHNDHLGRPEVVTNAAKATVWRASNYAFKRFVQFDTFGGLNIGFPGQYWDAESGLFHNVNRDYEQRSGRYLQIDPIGLAGGINTFGYANANPASYIDPLGLEGVGSFNNGGSRTLWEGGIRRLPDYFTLQINLGVTVLHYTVTKNGTLFSGGGGLVNSHNPARWFKGGGASLTAGFLDGCPDGDDVDKFIMGRVTTVGTAFGIEVSRSWNDAGSATNVGFGTPGIMTEHSYSGSAGKIFGGWW
ncbi:hypothetical protein LYSHEL_26290 [Lysobacter helvus]|uniref:RHS repeat-associated core domain-containing protein n=2 Tax=Lysobacteraceae TaxID=32033 RepID=A0ABM7Q831_9GAMM|nr:MULTISPECIES: RHS repeat-associated core domain-containing protein [Lysobacter]BCT93604.1 hypothetical protein LYSCAS_26280 [Lysobacter caseinilyticus]BCT96758.1 hypothetical protein LYSHEL_26290 [Lysobacter helvus]